MFIRQDIKLQQHLCDHQTAYPRAFLRGMLCSNANLGWVVEVKIVVSLSGHVRIPVDIALSGRIGERRAGGGVRGQHVPRHVLLQPVQHAPGPAVVTVHNWEQKKSLSIKLFVKILLLIKK